VIILDFLSASTTRRHDRICTIAQSFGRNFNWTFGGLKEWIIDTWLTGRLSQSPATSLRHLARPLLPLRAWNELDQDNCSNASSDLHRITGDDDAHSLRWLCNPRPPSRFVLLLIIASDQPIPFGRPRTHPSFHIPLQWFPPLELDSVHSIFLTHLLPESSPILVHFLGPSASSYLSRIYPLPGLRTRRFTGPRGSQARHSSLP